MAGEDFGTRFLEYRDAIISAYEKLPPTDIEIRPHITSSVACLEHRTHRLLLAYPPVTQEGRSYFVALQKLFDFSAQRDPSGFATARTMLNCGYISSLSSRHAQCLTR